MSRRQRSQPASAALLVATPALCFIPVGLGVAFTRWQWEVLCARICGPFLPSDWPPAWIESFRRAMDWHTPLVAAAAAALVLVAVLAHRRTGLRSGRGPAPR